MFNKDCKHYLDQLLNKCFITCFSNRTVDTVAAGGSTVRPGCMWDDWLCSRPLTRHREDDAHTVLVEALLLCDVVEVGWNDSRGQLWTQTHKVIRVYTVTAAWTSGCHTNTKEQRRRDDGSRGSGAGHQHGQHGPSEHQLLRQRCHHLVPEPHCISHTQPPRLNIWGRKVKTLRWRAHQIREHNPRLTRPNSPSADCSSPLKPAGSSIADWTRGPR